jgi:hypothetical protein
MGKRITHAPCCATCKCEPLLNPGADPLCPAPVHHVGCRAQLQDLDVPGVAQVTAQGLNLHVYSHGDFISSSLLRSQNWENHVITQLQWAINQYKPDTVSGCGTGNAQVHCKDQGNADCAS